MRKAALTLLVAGLAAAPVAARDDLGVFGAWGAFRDPAQERCYAIAMANPTSNRRDQQPFATVGSWPRRGVRGQFYVRLSRRLAAEPRVTLVLGAARIALTGRGTNAWASDKSGDAAIMAAMRSAGQMAISATDTAGRRFTDRYSLDGAATALDAATVGCVRTGR